MARLDMSELNNLELAVQSGAPDALFQLGLMYSTGSEVDEDLVSAHKWFNLAALRGNAAAREYRIEISREMSKVEIAKAQGEARKWLAER